MDGYGGGFGGNLGGFQLPDFGGLDLEGIASQIAKYTAEQDLANATNEYEKDAAETKLNQVKEYESGIAELPPIAEQVMQQLLPENGRGKPMERDIDIRDPIGRSSVVEVYDDGYDDYINYEPEEFNIPVTQPAATLPETITLSEPTEVLPELGLGELQEAYDFYNNQFVPGVFEGEKTIAPRVPFQLVPRVLPETTTRLDPPATVVMPRPTQPIYGMEDPAAQTGSEAIFDRGYVESNPAISNLIQQQRAAYGDALKKAVYRAPNRTQDDYVRPMSAAEFGSVPGRYTPPAVRPLVGNEPTPAVNTNRDLLKMNHGGALNLNSSSMNRGIGQLPPMQQNDKLTQLFAQSFNPRR